MKTEHFISNIKFIVLFFVSFIYGEELKDKVQNYSKDIRRFNYTNERSAAPSRFSKYLEKSFIHDGKISPPSSEVEFHNDYVKLYSV